MQLITAMRAFLFPALLGLSACHWGLIGVLAGSTSPPPYRAETIASELGAGSVRTLGCLDVGLALRTEDILDLDVGNRCAYPEPFDLERITIVGDGTTVVTLADPRSEIRELNIGGAERGHERVRLDHVNGVAHLCFDLVRLAPGAPESRPAPVCFAHHREGWSVL